MKGPAAFGARVATCWRDAADAPDGWWLDVEEYVWDAGTLMDEWRDADMDRVAGFLRRAYMQKPW